MREAEREAEREAYLTGQQPLLTRRELRRLREEEEALKAALASGQITAEQADALRNPLAAQPDIPVGDLSATGMHAAIRAEIADDATLRADAASEGETAQGAESEQSAASSMNEASTGAAEAAQAAAADSAAHSADHTVTATDVPEAGLGVEQNNADDATQEAEPAEEAASDVAADGAESAAQAAAQAETSVVELTEEEKLAISEVPTGEYSVEAIAAEGEKEAAASQVASGDCAASAETVGTRSRAGAADGGEANGRPVPTRRPIVRIPRSVQGVRSVDQHTGELTPVRPVDEDFEPIETPAWTALREGDGDSATQGVQAENAASRQDVAEAVESAVKAAESAEITTAVGIAANIDEAFPARPAGETGRRPIVASDGETINWRDVNNDAEDLALEEKSSPFMRHFLLALLVLVVVLVAATLLWFFLARPSTPTAAASALPLEALQAFLS